MKQVKRLNNGIIVNKWRSMIGGEREVEGELICYSNHRGNLKLYNDGSLYYYELLIADIVDGVHTVYDHTAAGGGEEEEEACSCENELDQQQRAYGNR